MSNNPPSNYYTCCRAACESAASCPHISELVNHLVQEALEIESRRAAVEESALWTRAFGPAAPKNRKEQVDNIVRIASARAVISGMRASVRRSNQHIEGGI
jgi:hypothetical protein